MDRRSTTTCTPRVQLQTAELAYGMAATPARTRAAGGPGVTCSPSVGGARPDHEIRAAFAPCRVVSDASGYRIAPGQICLPGAAGSTRQRRRVHHTCSALRYGSRKSRVRAKWR